VIAFAVHGMGASRRVPGDEDDDTVARTGCRQPARALSACVHAGKVEEVAPCGSVMARALQLHDRHVLPGWARGLRMQWSSSRLRR
jgi:hypothetical protein